MNRNKNRFLNHIRIMFQRKSIFSLILLAVPLVSSAQFGQDPDWPCIQRLVVDVAPGVIWNGPDPFEYGPGWEDSSEIVQIVNQVTGRRADMDRAKKLIHEFSENQTPDTKNKNLTKLFYGVWDTMNNQRKRYIKKIIKFSRHQQAVAIQVEALLNQLEESSSKPEAVESLEYQQIESTLNWHQRIYDQRERSMKSICDQPVLIEEHLGKIARIILAQLN